MSSASAVDVPDRLVLGSALQSFPNIGDIQLRSVDLSSTNNDPVQESLESLSLRQVAQRQSGSFGSVAFVVRRPGCSLCREHGQQLAELAAKHQWMVDEKDEKKFGLWGIIKEINVDDAGLIDFHARYFPFDIYRDEKLAVYQAMGNRKIFALRTWNPLRLYRGFRELASRLEEKQIDGNYIGEGIIQGGVLFFDKLGELRYAYEEETGNELNVDEILAGLRALEDGEQQQESQEL